MASILLIGVEPMLQAQLQPPTVGGDISMQAVPDTQQALSWIEHDRETLLAAVIGPDVDEPVRLAQRIHRLDKNIAVLILSENELHAQVNRAIQFTPFLGDHVTSVPRMDIPAVSETLQDAVLRGRQRRQFHTAVAAMNAQLESLSRPRISALQYLDHVLDFAPVGVVALDPDGYIISSNRRSGEILERSERDLLGVPLLQYFPTDERDRLDACIAQVHLDYTERESGVFARQVDTGDRQFLSVTVTAMRGDGEKLGTLVILQDVTTQVINEQEREEALKLRDEFLSVAAHELKTPLTSLKGYVELLGRQFQQTQWDHARVIRLQEQVHVQADRLELLVTDLLDASRIRQGRLDLRVEQMDLVELTQQALERLEDVSTASPPHSIVLDAPEPVIGVWDSRRIDQVITNLVSNALKYSPNGSEVRVVVRKRGEQAEFSVHDQGTGIDPELQASLFQPFVRGDQKGDVLGTGLGLYITSQIVEQHHGDISVTSTPGQGSTFSVRLPIVVQSRST